MLQVCIHQPKDLHTSSVDLYNQFIISPLKLEQVLYFWRFQIR